MSKSRNTYIESYHRAIMLIIEKKMKYMTSKSWMMNFQAIKTLVNVGLTPYWNFPGMTFPSRSFNGKACQASRKYIGRDFMEKNISMKHDTIAMKLPTIYFSNCIHSISLLFFIRYFFNSAWIKRKKFWKTTVAYRIFRIISSFLSAHFKR